MSKSDKDIEKVRMSIAGTIYNDCLPTSLISTSLYDICNQYNNYLKAERTNERKKMQDALNAIKADVKIINKQSVNSGSSYRILYPKDDSLESMRDIGESISIIYAIPYRTEYQIDYVGYAYGQEMIKMKSESAYERYEPDKYLNKWSIAIMENDATNYARNIYKYMNEACGYLKYYKSILAGEVQNSTEKTTNMMNHCFKNIEREVSNLNGEEPEVMTDEYKLRYLCSFIESSRKFSDTDTIEEMREEGVFRDVEAINQMIGL